MSGVKRIILHKHVNEKNICRENSISLEQPKQPTNFFFLDKTKQPIDNNRMPITLSTIVVI